MAKKDKSDLTYKIEKIYGYLNDDKTLIYASISWNDNLAKDEIRRVGYDDSGKIKYVGKGIALTPKEIKKLNKLMKDNNLDAEPVDFNNIFGQTPDIISGRQKGYQTEDGGFVKLIPR